MPAVRISQSQTVPRELNIALDILNFRENLFRFGDAPYHSERPAYSRDHLEIRIAQFFRNERRLLLTIEIKNPMRPLEPLLCTFHHLPSLNSRAIEY